MISLASMTPVPIGITCAGAIDSIWAKRLAKALVISAFAACPRFYCNDVTQKPATCQKKVSDNIEDLMPHEFVLDIAKVLSP